MVSTVGAVPLGVGKEVGKGVLHGGKGIIHGVGSTVGFAGRKTGLIRKRDKHGREVLVSDFEGEQHGLAQMGEKDLDNSLSADEAMVAQRSDGAGQVMPVFAATPAVTERDHSIHEVRAEAINITCAKAALNSAGSDVKPYVQLTLGRKSYKTGHAKRADADW